MMFVTTARLWTHWGNWHSGSDRQSTVLLFVDSNFSSKFYFNNLRSRHVTLPHIRLMRWSHATSIKRAVELPLELNKQRVDTSCFPDWRRLLNSDSFETMLGNHVAMLYVYLCNETFWQVGWQCGVIFMRPPLRYTCRPTYRQHSTQSQDSQKPVIDDPNFCLYFIFERLFPACVEFCNFAK